MLRETDPDTAHICLAHCFFDFTNYEQIYHYCNDDKEEAQKILNLLQNVEITDYLELIQLCDKLSTIDGYVTIQDKIQWYLNNRDITNKDEFCKFYSKHLNRIKTKLDELTGVDIYKLLEI
jgi:hypothetical protein